MKIALSDRLVSVLSYTTFGIFSLIWILYANFTKKEMSSFLKFNIFQAIFIAIILYIVSLIYEIAIKFLSVIPFIGKIIYSFNLFFNETPIYATLTLSGLLTTLLVIYLSIMSILGKKPYIPVISDIAQTNSGG